MIRPAPRAPRIALAALLFTAIFAFLLSTAASPPVLAGRAPPGPALPGPAPPGWVPAGAASSGPALASAAFPEAARAVQAQAGAPLRTRNVILITVDGLRIQELFGGMDPVVVSAKEKHSGIYDLDRARARYWRDTPEERREALMPFFWGTLAPKGIVLGNEEKASSVRPRNPLLFSGPGYMEILTGEYQPDVTTNDSKRYPHLTFLEYARQALGLGKMEVATIASWDGIGYFVSRKEGEFFTNAGYQAVPAEVATPTMKILSDLQFRIMALWETGRSDAVTSGLALEYLKKYRPRLMYIMLGETDDWAHARRYDRLLDTIRIFDDFLRELWQALEASESYRGKTTLILTTDHGRGVTPKDWVEHDTGIEGSEDIWIAVIGPDTPDRGEVAPPETVHQADIAATALRFLGLDWKKFNPQAGPPIAAAFPAEHPPVAAAEAAPHAGLQ